MIAEEVVEVFLAQNSTLNGPVLRRVHGRQGTVDGHVNHVETKEGGREEYFDVFLQKHDFAFAAGEPQSQRQRQRQWHS